MTAVRIAASILLLSLTLLGCSRDTPRRVAAPGPPPDAPAGTDRIEARWLEGSDLARAVSLASAHPLVRRSLVAAADPRLVFLPGSAVQALGTVPGGERMRVTILPYAVTGDSTFATYVTLIERSGRAVAIRWDWIEGRFPTSLETGFLPVDLSGRQGWARQREGYVLAAGRGREEVTERLNLRVFAKCLGQDAPPMCAAGAAIGRQIGGTDGPGGAVMGAAIGCGVGAAVAALGCAFQATK